MEDTPKRKKPVDSLFSELRREFKELIGTEIRLARTELGEKARQAKRGAISIAIGGVVLLISVFILLGALVAGAAALLSLAISPIVASWLAPLLVGIGAAITGSLVIRKGLTQLKPARLAPTKTIETIKENKEWLKEGAP